MCRRTLRRISCPNLPTQTSVPRCERTQRAVAALLQGDPEPEKELWSRRDDVTLANPFGGYRRGWPEVEAGLDLAADGFAKGGTCVFEEISREAGPDHGFVFEMERFESNLTDGRGVASGALRVIMIFRMEDGEWKLVHRQADTLTEFGAHDDAIHQPVRRMKTLHTAYRVTDLTGLARLLHHPRIPRARSRRPGRRQQPHDAQLS